MVASINLALIQQPASRVFGCLTLKSAGISLLLSFESLLCFLTCLFSPTTLLHGEVEALAPDALLFQRQVLLVFVRAASEGEVGACISGIQVSRPFHS